MGRSPVSSIRNYLIFSDKLKHNGDFFQEVYALVKEIPAGCVVTYGQIASLIGHPSAARRVGQALFNAPPEADLPCHRVVNSQGRLAPFWADQRGLLEEEGVSFKKNGCVDMKKHTWGILTHAEEDINTGKKPES